MAAFRLPGPLCLILGALKIDAGTLCRATSQPPGVLSGPPNNQGGHDPGPSTGDGALLNQAMIASDNAARFIASFEAMGFICPDFKVRAYQDGGCGIGNWTVGVGEMSGRNANSVFESEVEAYNSFVAKVKGDYTNRVRTALKNKGVKRPLTQYEFDALVDLAYQKGNCMALAQTIAEGKLITETDFISQTKGHEDRRGQEYKLFSGMQVTVNGYLRYFRFDNTNGGYCQIDGKPGYKVLSSSEEYTLTY